MKLRIRSLSIKHTGSVKLPYFVFRWTQRRLFVFSLLKVVGLFARKPQQTSLGKNLGQILGCTGHHSDQVYLFITHLFICMMTEFR